MGGRGGYPLPVQLLPHSENVRIFSLMEVGRLTQRRRMRRKKKRWTWRRRGSRRRRRGRRINIDCIASNTAQSVSLHHIFVANRLCQNGWLNSKVYSTRDCGIQSLIQLIFNTIKALQNLRFHVLCAGRFTLYAPSLELVLPALLALSVGSKSRLSSLSVFSSSDPSVCINPKVSHTSNCSLLFSLKIRRQPVAAIVFPRDAKQVVQ